MRCPETLVPALQVLQHAWTYRPMVHDVLGMSLNRITLEADPPQVLPVCMPL